MSPETFPKTIIWSAAWIDHGFEEREWKCLMVGDKKEDFSQILLFFNGNEAPIPLP